MSFMNIVLLVCDSPGSKYFSNILKKNNIAYTLVIERGTATREKILRKIFTQSNVLKWPFKILDLVALIIYRKLTDLWLHTKLLVPTSSKHYPSDVPQFHVDYVNSKETLQLLDRLQPDLMIIFGTSILKEDTIRKSKKYTLNIHTGIVPFYRNVHGDFWLLANKDYVHAGSTIMYVDTGIDSGDIALQKELRLTNHDSIVALKRKLLILSSDMLLESIILAKKGLLPRKKQEQADAVYYNTPTFFDFIRNIRNLLYVDL